MLIHTSRRNSTNAAIDRAVREALGTIPGYDSATRAAFQRLLRHARRSGLLRTASFGGRSGARGCDEFVAGLLSLAGFDWLRPVEDWEPATTRCRSSRRWPGTSWRPTPSPPS